MLINEYKHMMLHRGLPARNKALNAASSLSSSDIKKSLHYFCLYLDGGGGVTSLSLTSFAFIFTSSHLIPKGRPVTHLLCRHSKAQILPRGEKPSSCPFSKDPSLTHPVFRNKTDLTQRTHLIQVPWGRDLTYRSDFAFSLTTTL